jgi:hypothetical protein
MLTFCILKSKNSSEGLEVVETGFSLIAFLFGPIWALFKKLWFYSIIGITFLAGFNLILKIIHLPFLFFLISLISSLFWGFFARDLQIQYLISKDYTPLKLINAKSKESALVKFLSEES